jgi:hypothetical protein
VRFTAITVMRISNMRLDAIACIDVMSLKPKPKIRIDVTQRALAPFVPFTAGDA